MSRAGTTARPLDIHKKKSNKLHTLQVCGFHEASRIVDTNVSIVSSHQGSSDNQVFLFLCTVTVTLTVTVTDFLTTCDTFDTDLEPQQYMHSARVNDKLTNHNSKLNQARFTRYFRLQEDGPRKRMQKNNKLGQMLFFSDTSKHWRCRCLQVNDMGFNVCVSNCH